MSTFTPWAAKKNGILVKYTTSTKLSITTVPLYIMITGGGDVTSHFPFSRSSAELHIIT